MTPTKDARKGASLAGRAWADLCASDPIDEKIPAADNQHPPGAGHFGPINTVSAPPGLTASQPISTAEALQRIGEVAQTLTRLTQLNRDQPGAPSLYADTGKLCAKLRVLGGQLWMSGQQTVPLFQSQQFKDTFGRLEALQGDLSRPMSGEQLAHLLAHFSARVREVDQEGPLAAVTLADDIKHAGAMQVRPAPGAAAAQVASHVAFRQLLSELSAVAYRQNFQIRLTMPR